MLGAEVVRLEGLIYFKRIIMTSETKDISQMSVDELQECLERIGVHEKLCKSLKGKALMIFPRTSLRPNV